MTAQSKESLLVYTEKMDSLYIDVSKYDYILVFDIYVCQYCISPKIKGKKILLIPLDNDATFEIRIHQKLTLKRDYPKSDCYFLNSEEKKLAIVQNYQKNQLVNSTHKCNFLIFQN
jgi:hypothetical protein